MASATGSEISAEVQSNLGARTSGTIGGVDIATSIMRSVNRAMMAAVKGYEPPELERNLTLAITTANYRYALPVVDATNAAIRIKNFAAEPILVGAAADVEYSVPRATAWLRDRNYYRSRSDEPARPMVYAIFSSYLELFPWPDTTYTMYLRVNIFPIKFTSTTLSNSHCLGEEWDDVIIAYATADMFRKLQQIQEAADWFSTYRSTREETLSLLKWMPERIFSMNDMERHQEYRSADPLNDPFVRKYN